MNTSPRITALVIAFAILNGGTPSATVAALPPQPAVPVSSPPNVDSNVTSMDRPPELAERLSTEQQQLVDWGQTRFRQAGLELPEVDFYFHADTLACHGHVGIYYQASRSLHICRLDKPTILHELAHAWTHHNLEDQQRATFTTLRGLDGWNDHSRDRGERATEHAAEIIAWGLMDRNLLVRWATTTDTGSTQLTWRLLTIDDSGPDRLIEAYEFLTGTRPTRRLEDDPRLTTPSEVTSPEARRSN
jgi:hypothetical protein